MSHNLLKRDFLIMNSQKKALTLLQLLDQNNLKSVYEKWTHHDFSLIQQHRETAMEAVDDDYIDALIQECTETINQMQLWEETEKHFSSEPNINHSQAGVHETQNIHIKWISDLSVENIVFLIQDEPDVIFLFVVQQLSQKKVIDLLPNLIESRRCLALTCQENVYDQTISTLCFAALMDKQTQKTSGQTKGTVVQKSGIDQENMNKWIAAISLSDEKEKEFFFQTLSKTQVENVEYIRNRIITFESLWRQSDQTTQMLLNTLDRKLLAIALIDCKDDLFLYIINFLSERAQVVLKEERVMKKKNTSKQEIEQAQRDVIKKYFELKV